MRKNNWHYILDIIILILKILDGSDRNKVLEYLL